MTTERRSNERKPDVLRHRARRLHADGRSISAVAKALGVAFSSAHRWINAPDEFAQADPAWLLAVSKPWRRSA